MQIRCDGCFEIYDDQYEICPHCGYYHGAKPKEPFALEIGTLLEDRYVIGNEVGLGGFGITYKAWDQVLETAVAIKEYYPSSMVNRVPGTQEVIRFESKLSAFQFGLDRLILEAQYMAQFNTHDNIVHVLSYFEANNTAYIVMEFLEGCTLGEYVRENGLKTLEESVDIVLQICDALQEIHRVGIIHRDISPDNIFMCSNGKVKLIDFGAARFSQNMESNYTVILKPGFAPAEQYTKISEQGPWTDVYAVGATLYYLVTGQKPEESTNRKTKDTLAEPIELKPEIPQYLSDCIMKAMAIEPHLRFQTIPDFVAVLKKEKKVVSLKTEKSRRRIKRFAGIAALLAVLAIVVGYFISEAHQKHEYSVLPPAAIEMWYVENEENTLGGVYETIIHDFSEVYPKVTVQARGFADAQTLRAALDSGTPALVQTDGTAAVTNCPDLEKIAIEKPTNVIQIAASKFKKDGGNPYLFLHDYSDCFPDHNFIPTGFSVPVLYVNTSLVSFDADEIETYADLQPYMEEGAAVVDVRLQDVYASFFFTGEGLPLGTVEDFLSGSAAFFLSDTSTFFTVRTIGTQRTGLYKVVPIRADALPCTWAGLWQIIPRSEAQDAVAERFLSFLLSDNAQVKLSNNRDGAHALPINKNALETFCGIFDDMDFVPNTVKHCVFGKIR